MRTDGLHRVTSLTAEDLDAIEHLAEVCNAHDGSRLRLNREMLATRPQGHTRDWLAMHDGALAGCLMVFAFGPEEAELLGMVAPTQRRQGIFTQLYDAAREDAINRGVARLLLVVERGQSTGEAVAARLGATLDHSEYAMELADPPPTPLHHTDLTLRPAVPEDARALVRILAAAFGEDEEDPVDFAGGMASQPHRRWLVAEVAGQPIATLGLVGDGAETAIYGVAVLPDWQGHGYGRALLSQTIADLLAGGPRHIILEVATDNARALGLYTRLGFRQVTAYDYYRVAVPSASAPR